MPTRYAKTQLVSWNILEHYHIDPFYVFAKVKLDPQRMYEEEYIYPLRKVLNLWDEMARIIPDQAFGLVAGQHWHPSFLGSLGYALLAAPSLRSTLETFVEYNFFITQEESKCHIEENREKQTITFFSPSEPPRPGTEPREDSFIASAMHILNTNYIGGELNPVEIRLRRKEPPRPGKYFETLKSRVLFGQDQTSIELTLQDVDYALPTGTESLNHFTENEMKNYQLQKDKLSLTYRTRTLTEENLIKGSMSIEHIAKGLYLSSKSLQRILKTEGTTFSEILEKSRIRLAKEYLRKNIDMAEIAFLLGFSEQSVFSRSFKKWTGSTPSQYKEEVVLPSNRES